MTAALWQMAQVADRLALTPAAFRARRRRLEADHGFPPPVPGLGLRWDGLAVEAWLARNRDQAGSICQPVSVEDVLIARARALAA